MQSASFGPADDWLGIVPTNLELLQIRKSIYMICLILMRFEKIFLAGILISTHFFGPEIIAFSDCYFPVVKNLTIVTERGRNYLDSRTISFGEAFLMMLYL